MLGMRFLFQKDVLKIISWPKIKKSSLELDAYDFLSEGPFCTIKTFYGLNGGPEQLRGQQKSKQTRRDMALVRNQPDVVMESGPRSVEAQTWATNKTTARKHYFNIYILYRYF